MSHQHPNVVTVSCPDCGVSKDVDPPNQAIAFYRRHNKLTGHDVEIDRADVGVETEVPHDGDVGVVVAELETRFDDGVPLGVVAAVTSEHGVTVGETLAAVRERRLRGELYEPRDDHLRAT
ncbi:MULTISPECIES: hypothetical protein [Halorussus]|uniref:hypothetical protein n=1 Tax=Halorussus TaxID=1070314 RepID=UPI0020A1EBDD|nr:hypothetical protein [Halorussus vallis]USZ74520.1 hypothetical protein NGM07_13835 [Halorussus vallis]